MNERSSEEPLRELTDLERAYLGRLLAVDFPGREQVAQQIRSALARRIDEEGSVELVTRSTESANVTKRVPVEGGSVDLDGVPISFLLHVVGSQIRELEIYKADGSPIKRMPAPEQVDVVVLPG
jgi:hypothetical protein